MPRSESTPTEKRCAARLPLDSDRQEEFKRRAADFAPNGVETFRPRDTHELNDRICTGEFHRVLFANLDDLLDAIWNGDANLTAWRERGIDLVLLDESSPEDSLKSGGAAESTETSGRSNGAVSGRMLDRIYLSHTQWRRRHRGSKLIAALVLSAIGIAAVAILALLAPMTR